MGMSASQARLLSITSQMHDIENKAGNIENLKLQLATQREDVYQKYCDALDAQNIQLATYSSDMKKSFIDANFSTLCTYNKNNNIQYGLVNNKNGKIFTTQEMYDAYQNCANNKYTFAYLMLGYTQSNGLNLVDAPMTNSGQLDTNNCADFKLTSAENQVLIDNYSSDSSLRTMYDNIISATTDTDKKQAINDFRNYLHSHYASDIYDLSAVPRNSNNEDWSECEDEFNYYVRYFDLIEQSQGCEVIDNQYLSGNEANKWFNGMVDSGLVGIKMVDRYDLQKEWSEVNVNTSIDNNYLQKNTASEAEIKKAETEYEHNLSLINKKDTEYDKTLSNLETMRSSLKEQLEGLKKVIQDNQDRTYKIFS